MAKIATDRTTIDLFALDKRPGRPKTNLLPREEQLKQNKRNQIKRDRVKGLKRIECKVPEQLCEKLDLAAAQANMTRSHFIEHLLEQALAG
ncbi:LexA regulated protein [Alishewanella sp. 16-MA]|uniref:LexA regulated protein n=1 Tax=Alishewanella maricola TaxID=2795740 RepID=A0ABS8C521_9ALTE|nr:MULTISPECIES: LexA regulated protein [Gammaproteobacteria]MDP5034876.1 LexA regulated protein [Alishewanella sp.]MCB5227419.1 LexA regulated protein [Alishewanella maricola]MCC5452011.1 LexA regulated protein [Rheinheimera sp. UJ51]MCF4009854.1 LexA regulated protein [Rheinheimera sp. UJ63]MDP5186036.1 LexA regulated protein [Alishewanella sp.]